MAEKPVFHEKECVECHKKYTPSGHCQKRCPECMKTKPRKKTTQIAQHKEIVLTAPTASLKNSVIEENPGEGFTINVDSTVLAILVAFGAVSQAKVDSVRKFVQGFGK